MPGGGLNRQLTTSLTDFKQQKTVQDSVQNFNIKQKHQPKGFLSDRRFDLVTKISGYGEASASNKNFDSISSKPDLSARTDKSVATNTKPPEAIFCCSEVIEDQ